jgi:hypothetical protein
MENSESGSETQLEQEGWKMKGLKLAVCALFLAAAVAAPLPAQTLDLRANIPFEFYVGNQVLPAGNYQIDTRLANGVARIWNLDTNRSVVLLVQKDQVPAWMSREEAVVVFHRYGERYFLSDVRDGYARVQYRMRTTPAEAEFSNRAALGRPDGTVMIPARVLR